MITVEFKSNGWLMGELTLVKGEAFQKMGETFYPHEWEYSHPDLGCVLSGKVSFTGKEPIMNVLTSILMKIKMEDRRSYHGS